MFKVNDKVRVKLHEPIGSPTTKSANRYLENFVDRECWILLKCENPNMYMIGVQHQAGKYNNIAYVYVDELEAIDV